MLAKQLSAAAAAAEPVFIESVFSTYLYTGDGSFQRITNGIDLAGKGGLVWLKSRSAATNHFLNDTARSPSGFSYLSSNTTAAASILSAMGYFSDGFSLPNTAGINTNGATYTSWTFRKQPKFFDVVTYTGNGVAGRQIAHSLGVEPGCIIIKKTSSTGNWPVYHRFASGNGETGNSAYLQLNTTIALTGGSAYWNNTHPTATTFFLGNATDVNQNGATYVAYLFAHNAGGFGLTGTDNVISCGSYTGSSSDVSINLGYEAQWVMVKNVSRSGTNWQMLDIMRGMPLAGNAKTLAPNLADAESSPTAPVIVPTATGITITGGFGYAINYNGDSYIYIAIRRGPMKTPTSGTSVFSPIASSAATGTTLTTNFPVDMQIGQYRLGAANAVVDRLRGVSTNATGAGIALATSSTAAEGTASGGDSSAWDNTGFNMPSNLGGISDIFWNFRRAPGFFDEVCWTGDGTGNARNHNLTVYPELVISKLRSGGAGFGAWNVQNNINPSAKQTGFLNTTAAFSSSGATSPTANVFYPTDDQSGATCVTYLFATCPGVSKVGSYTGNGSTQTINCGFTGGARFVLIKSTSTTGNWYVWDSARGIVAGNDPYLLFNSTAAEVTTTDWVDTASSGFELSNAAGNLANSNGVSYIFLAIA